jgi:hypothetical protein
MPFSSFLFRVYVEKVQMATGDSTFGMTRWNPDIQSLSNDPAENAAALLIPEGSRLNFLPFVSESIYLKEVGF